LKAFIQDFKNILIGIFCEKKSVGWFFDRGWSMSEQPLIWWLTGGPVDH
jgi:hypothetical protein